MHASVRKQPPMTSSSCNLSDKFLSLLFLPDRAKFDPNNQRNAKEKKAEWIVKETAKSPNIRGCSLRRTYFTSYYILNGVQNNFQ